MDNDSTYTPLLEYYASLQENGSAVVLYLRKNLGYKAVWESGILNVLDVKTPYVYSDPDILPTKECPYNIVEILFGLLEKYPFVKKAGLGLKTDDITYANAAKTKELERAWTRTRLSESAYFGSVDTTFALYRNYRHYSAYEAIRTGGNMMARHLPWYLDFDNLPEDEKYYMEHATKEASTFQMVKESTGTKSLFKQ